MNKKKIVGGMLIIFLSASMVYASQMVWVGQELHNFLSGLQGGSEGEYYHINASVFTELTEWIDNVILGSEGNLTVSGNITSTDRYCNATDCYVISSFLNDTDTRWDLNTSYLFNNSEGGILDFNETHLNATIAALDTNCTVAGSCSTIVYTDGSNPLTDNWPVDNSNITGVDLLDADVVNTSRIQSESDVEIYGDEQIVRGIGIGDNVYESAPLITAIGSAGAYVIAGAANSAMTIFMSPSGTGTGSGIRMWGNRYDLAARAGLTIEHTGALARIYTNKAGAGVAGDVQIFGQGQTDYGVSISKHSTLGQPMIKNVGANTLWFQRLTAGPTYVNLIPNGANVAQFAVFGTDYNADTTNYAYVRVTHDASNAILETVSGGSGTRGDVIISPNAAVYIGSDKTIGNAKDLRAKTLYSDTGGVTAWDVENDTLFDIRKLKEIEEKTVNNKGVWDLTGLVKRDSQGKVTQSVLNTIEVEETKLRNVTDGNETREEHIPTGRMINSTWVDTGELSGYLIGVLKAQQKQIDGLIAEIESLKEQRVTTTIPITTTTIFNPYGEITSSTSTTTTTTEAMI